jgi:ribonucleoside-diphosphate reductase beta chain
MADALTFEEETETPGPEMLAGCCGDNGDAYDLKKPFKAEDKRLLNCRQVDVNQLMPLKYEWAWEHYLNGCANHWMPTEVPMQRDIELWRSDALTDAERQVILRNLGFFSTGESLVGNNIVLAIFKHITNSEARQYLLRQAFEEAIHTHTFHYIVESLGLDGREVFNMYHEVSSIQGKDQFVMNMTSDVLDPNFTTESIEGMQKFIKNLIGFYVINTIKVENPGVWTHELQRDIYDMVNEAVEYEVLYARDCLPEGVMGLNETMFREYVQFIADRRLERIGLASVYGSQNPFPWMGETIDIVKEKNFFETRVTDYQSAGALSWDE